MIFSSYIFLFAFLPIVVALYALISVTSRRRLTLAWLVLSSFVYYGWWDPRYLLLLIPSIGLNYCIGVWLGKTQRVRIARFSLTIGIASNLILLGWFKYANFFLDNVNAWVDTGLALPQIVLPIGISFFTFQQIAYLVDAYRGESREYNLIDYTLFVTFFPQLIAGPIVHHKEILPQFDRHTKYPFNATDASIGLTILAIGLFKKVVLADNLVGYVTPTYSMAVDGNVGFADAWIATLAYTLQIYFDFSGYSDMAIGIARIFGILLPLNFNSPYKSQNIVEFWRRWHITLSRFLRDYLYIPLGGNRRGLYRRYFNLMLTMLLGGLWHGAGWTFVVWGLLHGAYLCINHLWHTLTRHCKWRQRPKTIGHTVASTGLTFMSVVVAWVFFRAPTFDSAINILTAMAGVSSATSQSLVDFQSVYALILAALLTVWLLPNTQEIMSRYRPALQYARRTGFDYRHKQSLIAVRWRPTWYWAVATAVVCGISILEMAKYSEFIYYQF